MPSTAREVSMLVPNVERTPGMQQIGLAQIDAVVSARLGPARVPGNAQPAAFNRQVAMYLAKHVGGWSTTKIGRFYNGRDHSTVCYAIRRDRGDAGIPSGFGRLADDPPSGDRDWYGCVGKPANGFVGEAVLRAGGDADHRRILGCTR